MSIATAIQNAQDKVAAAYTAVNIKGGTLPATQDLSNLPTAITSIPTSGGGTDNLPLFVSSGVSTFEDNTITKIRSYAFYDNRANVVTNPITSVSCSSVTEVGANCFTHCSSLQTISLPSLVTVGASSFEGCSSLTSLPLPSTVTTIGDGSYSSCTAVTEFTIPSGVTYISDSAFKNITNAEVVNYNATNASFESGSNNDVFHDLGSNKNNLVFNIGSNVENIPPYFLYPTSFGSHYPNIQTLNISNSNSIKTIGRYAFYYCTGLTSLNLPSMTILNTSGAMTYAFSHCTNLTSLSFPSLTSTSFGSYTNQFNNMLSNVTGCTVHFPSNLQSVIGSWTDVTNGFGGTNTTVLFDLTATE